MISKLHFGKRIASLRKENKLSQVDLADKFGVTSQAVSKWECGTALPDIELLLELSNLYKVSINELLEGKSIIAKLANRSFKMDEIAYFVPKMEWDYNVSWINDIVTNNWISRNWNYCMSKENE